MILNAQMLEKPLEIIVFDHLQKFCSFKVKGIMYVKYGCSTDLICLDLNTL